MNDQFLLQSCTGNPCRRIPAASVVGAVDDLVLTMPDDRPSPCSRELEDGTTCDQPIESDLRLLQDTARGGCPPVLSPPSGQDERTRYRWLVGHHAVVAIWQWQVRLLQLLASAARPAPGLVRAVARLYDTYTLLFLYAGSCSAQRYADTVRADMYARNPAFSGQWGRDHELIPPLLHRVRRTHPASFLTPLVNAVKLNHRVHVAIANKLVPEGRSLFQEAGRKPDMGPTNEERDLFDSFFRIRRGQLCRRAFTAQTIRRLAHVTCDVRRHGLTDADAAPPRLGGADAEVVEHIEADATRLLLHSAEIVTTPEYYATIVRQRPRHSEKPARGTAHGDRR